MQKTVEAGKLPLRLQDLSEQWLNLAPAPSQWPIPPELSLSSARDADLPRPKGAQGQPKPPDFDANKNPEHYFLKAVKCLNQSDQLSFEASIIAAQPKLSESLCDLFLMRTHRETSPQNIATAYILFSLCHLQPQKQLAPLSRAIGFAPEIATAHGLMAQAYTKMGLYIEAQASVDQALTLLPQSAYAKTALARIHLHHGNPNGAFEILKNPSEVDFKYFGFNVAYGITLLHRNNRHKASFHFHEAIRLNNRHADGHAGLATAFLMRRQIGEAIQSYEVASTCQDISPCMIQAFANRLFDEGCLTDALHFFAKVQQTPIAPKHAILLKFHAESQIGNGQPEINWPATSLRS